MTIEEDVFRRYTVDFDKLKKFGFKKQGNIFVIEKSFKENLFKAVITINLKSDVSGIVYDVENDDEFLLLKAQSAQGAFVGEVRDEYKRLLEKIRDNCFSKKYYIYPQSNRITNLIKQKYGDEPEFLWEKFQGSGIFRNPETKKWYLAILDADRSKIQKDEKGLIEVALIKQSAQNVEKRLKQKHIYPGYHMNKKYWISIILDDSLADSKIMNLIDESHDFTVKKPKR